jgi:hypothetical protein
MTLGSKADRWGDLSGFMGLDASKILVASIAGDSTLNPQKFAIKFGDQAASNPFVGTFVAGFVEIWRCSWIRKSPRKSPRQSFVIKARDKVFIDNQPAPFPAREWGGRPW